MALIFDGTTIDGSYTIKMDGVTVDKVVMDGVTVWESLITIEIKNGNFPYNKLYVDGFTF